jgi:hypothetical protein
VRRVALTAPPVLALFVLVTGLAACATDEDVTVLETSVVSWPGDGGGTLGQVIVAVRNDSDRHVDPDVLGRGRVTAARLLAADGAEIPGGDARVQLHAAPAVLAPGEDGYLIGSFRLDGDGASPASARVEINADDANPPTPVEVIGFTLTDEPGGIGAEGEVAWDESGTAVVRAIALDDEGVPIGYAGTDEVRYSSGPFTMCCFPPELTRESIGEVVVYGLQARDDG